VYLHHCGVKRIVNALEDRPDIEIIVSEDLPIMESGIKGLPNWQNITYSKNSPPLGAVPNWNYTLKSAKGEFVWVIHHDEVPNFPHGLDVFLKHLKETNVDLLMSRLNKDSDNILKRTVRSDLIRRTLLHFPKSILLQNYIGSPSNIIVRRSRLEDFDQRIQWFVDMEWFFRLIKALKIVELSQFGITPIPHDKSIKASLGEKVTEISNLEIEYICSKHQIGGLFRLVWLIKIFLRDNYFRMRASA